MGVLTGKLVAVAMLAFVGGATGAKAGAVALDPAKVIKRSQAAIGTRLGPHVLFDSHGNPLPLSGYRGRPLVISLIYTGCNSICPVTTQRVLQAVISARKVLGEKSFAVLTLGFDAGNDTPARLKEFARLHGVDQPDWRFAGADRATTAAILNELGFTYVAAAGAFRHPATTTIIDARGRVYRHVYGDSFPDQVFIEPLKELVFGTSVRSYRIHDLIDRIRFICTVYNPGTGAYEFNYAILFGVTIGGLSLLLMALVIVHLWRINRRFSAERSNRSRG